ncbi:MAG: hypothetical protein CMP11_06000 [Zetaproteobacteria bacterium]|nr:hypothetical protein [Pseudobdellovibrionaceae bacterium]
MIDLIEAGDPPAKNAGVFGLSSQIQDSRIVLIPVNWDATASYGYGTSKAPQKILEASHQLDLFDPFYGEPYKMGITMIDELKDMDHLNEKARQLVQERRELLPSFNDKIKEKCLKVNQLSERVNSWVEETSQYYLDQGKIVGVVGGDHSSPYGLIKSLSKKYDSFAVLHIDAHFDLRKSYEGFEYSHASIMYNVLTKIPQVKKICQIGIRDFSKGEYRYNENLKERSRTFFDRQLARNKVLCKPFFETIKEIIRFLPERIYVSFDVDGLDPKLCPSTGTPVPGGLDFSEVQVLFEELSLSGKKIIGFDLCEVNPRENIEYDQNVGARVLYKLCSLSLGR